ncbi:MAG: diiron oxygenase [Kofleriaceae bacterium]
MAHASPTTEPATAATAATAAYRAQLERLSAASVSKRYHAYEDIDWGAAEHQIDSADPRWEIRDDDPLRDTPWYRALPQPLRAKVGLHRIISRMRMGVLFENILQRGLLEFLTELPAGSAEFRYAMHELIEEGEHSLMFQEFIHRTGLTLPALSRLDRNLGGVIALVGRLFPELFFLFVLGGETPIDHDQRRSQAAPWERHPLLRRIEQIHITEEARHLRFAACYLREHVPRLPAARMRLLQLLAPLVLAYMFKAMMTAPPGLTQLFGAPAAEIAAAYRGHRELTAQTLAAFTPVRELCRELGVLTAGTRWLWVRCGLEARS